MQRNLEGPLVYDQIYHISISKRVDPDQEALLIWISSVCKSIKRQLYEVKGYRAFGTYTISTTKMTSKYLATD